MSGLPRGIWFDASRKRYRVRLYQGTSVFHLSYHASKDEALSAYHAALSRKLKPFEERAIETPLDRLAALQGQGRPAPAENLITVNEMLKTYFALKPPNHRTVWRWIRERALPARRIGRAYFLAPADIEQFIRSH
jgi:hypothetical protein